MSLERIDPIFESLLTASSDLERQRELERVVTEAGALAERVIRRYSSAQEKLSAADVDDIRSTVTFRFMRRLQALVGAGGGEAAILSFEDYVAQLTHNAINDHLRAAFPERTRLKSRLRYLLSRDERFALWQTAVGMAAGLAAWRDRADVRYAFDVPRAEATPAMADASKPDLALEALFQRSAAPIRFDAVVETLAALWDIVEDDVPQPAGAADVIAEQEMRDLVQVLWREVLLLPQAQRAALLLNLRVPDGVDAISLLILSRIATMGEIAGALDITVTQLADMWSELPLSDNLIAERFSISRQQVINLRKSARERLARRIDRKRRRRT